MEPHLETSNTPSSEGHALFATYPYTPVACYKPIIRPENPYVGRPSPESAQTLHATDHTYVEIPIPTHFPRVRGSDRMTEMESTRRSHVYLHVDPSWNGCQPSPHSHQRRTQTTPGGICAKVRLESNHGKPPLHFHVFPLRRLPPTPHSRFPEGPMASTNQPQWASTRLPSARHTHRQSRPIPTRLAIDTALLVPKHTSS